MLFQFTCPVCHNSYSSNCSSRKYCSRPCLNIAKTWKHTPDIERFWRFVDKTSSPFGCWLWTGGLTWGYGTFQQKEGGDKTVRSVRYLWEHERGPIPNKLHLLHNCDVFYPVDSIEYRRCLNLDHVRLGTPKENAQDMWDKGRGVPNSESMQGTQNPSVKLTEEKVLHILSLKGTLSYDQIAKQEGVGKSTISRIMRRSHWVHLSVPEEILILGNKAKHRTL